jgi:hypothetical protein
MSWAGHVAQTWIWQITHISGFYLFSINTCIIARYWHYFTYYGFLTARNAVMKCCQPCSGISLQKGNIHAFPTHVIEIIFISVGLHLVPDLMVDVY